MAAIAFDTHAFVKRLTASGMPEAQAEVLADEQVRLLERQLATKAYIGSIEAEMARLRESISRDMQGLQEAAARDVEGLRQEVKHDIIELRAEIRSDLRDLQHRLTLRTGTLLASAVAIITASVKLL